MAKVTGPLLSIGASGQIGNSQVYAKWKGIAYARRYIVPANPNTTGQQLTRSVFKATDNQWKYMGALARAPWNAAVKGRAMVPRNLLMSNNIPTIRAADDISAWVMSPGNGGGIALASLSAETGSVTKTIDVTFSVPTAPNGWTHVSTTVTAIPNRAPGDMTSEQDTETSVADGTSTATLTVPQGNVEYVINAFPIWTTSAGVTVYGHSLVTTATSDT